MNLTHAKKRKFLDAVAKGASVLLAAKAAGTSRQCPYHWRVMDAEFADAWDDAKRQGIDRLEDELRRRAYDGIQEDIFFEGKIVGQKLKHSDTLLMFLLRASAPEKYCTRREVRIDGTIDFTAALVDAHERARLENAL